MLAPQDQTQRPTMTGPRQCNAAHSSQRSASSHGGRFNTRWPLQHTVAAASHGGRFNTRWPLHHTMAAASHGGRCITRWPLHHTVDCGQAWRLHLRALPVVSVNHLADDHPVPEGRSLPQNQQKRNAWSGTPTRRFLLSIRRSPDHCTGITARPIDTSTTAHTQDSVPASVRFL